MAPNVFVGDGNGKAQKVSKIYVGDGNGKARLVKAAYVGDGNGKARKIWPYTLLPATYQRVEYILNSGQSQYIDCGIKANSSTRVSADIKITSVAYNNNDYWGSFSAYFGAMGVTDTGGSVPAITIRGSSYYFQIIITVSNWKNYATLRYSAQTNYTSFYFDNYNGRRNVISINRDGLGHSYINNDLIQSSTETFSNTEGNILIFAGSFYHYGRQQISYSSSGECQIYQFAVWQNDSLIRNMYPCYRKSDNVIGMYDIVNNVFYTNAGSGTFYKGPNVDG